MRKVSGDNLTGEEGGGDSLVPKGKEGRCEFRWLTLQGRGGVVKILMVTIHEEGGW